MTEQQILASAAESALPTSLGEATEIAELSKYGTFDYAVPLAWSDKNPDAKAVWLYPRKPGYLFGRPLTYLAILRLARRKCKDAFDRLRIDAAIATFRPHKLTATNLLTLLNA